MFVASYLDQIKAAFAANEGPVEIPMLRSRGGRSSFTAQLQDDGIVVSNLANQPVLPWKVFEVAIDLMLANGGKACKGLVQHGKLGDAKLPVESIEGAIARDVYGLEVGKSGFRRITPIAGILRWAGVCDDAGGELILKPLRS